jgi:hypothetical protein
MVCSYPSNISGNGGRGGSATKEDMIFMNDFTYKYFHGGTNVLAAV